MTPAKRRNFERLLNPRHIAFVGGTDAGIAIGEARRRGYAGQIWVVNPKRDTLAGLPCLPRVTDLPDPPDAVFLAVPAAAVPDAVRDLAQMGAGGIVCYSAGFGEAHEQGRHLEDALKTALGDMALIGPNCYGLINYIGNSALWPFAHGGFCPGYGAAILTQSGMLSSDITMSQRSLPLAYMMSVGNQADLGLAELVDLLCEREEVRALGLHIEGLSDIPAFEKAALKALNAGKPIVALKTGSSAIGESLTLGHTGSLAGSKELYQALFERAGIIGVTNPSQMLETLKFLCVAGAPDGPDVVGFTASGGGATMLADHAETIGLSFPAPDQQTRQTLTGLLPPIASVSNPLDYTTPIWGQAEQTQPVFSAAMSGIPVQSAILVQDYPAPGLDETEQLYLNDGTAFANAAAQTGLSAAVCATISENMGAHIRESFLSQGVAPMQGIHETLNAIRDGAWWTAARDRIIENMPGPLIAAPAAGRCVLLSEAQAKRRLARAGIPIPSGQTGSGAQLDQIAEDIGYPVALKMMSPRLAHKTEAGAVALGLSTPAELTRAASDMHDRVARFSAHAVSDTYLIERMALPPLAELVVGVKRDAQFGLAMTLGSGGVLVDLVGDAISVLLPARPDEIARALNALRVGRLLDGFRGKPAVNKTLLVASLCDLAEFALAHAGTIAEIEINPLFVYENDVLAVDALMQVQQEPDAS